jgi:hypothetical protein
MSSEFPHMTDCDIGKKLEVTISATNSDLVVACWGITLGELRKHPHCGEHTQIIRACIESLQLPGLMKKVRIQLDALWASGLTNLRVICICEKGVQKSVAFAAIMQDIYHQEGYNSKGPHHLSKCDALPSICWNCTECKANVQKATLMSVAQAEFIRGQLL